MPSHASLMKLNRRVGNFDNPVELGYRDHHKIVDGAMNFDEGYEHRGVYSKMAGRQYFSGFGLPHPFFTGIGS